MALEFYLRRLNLPARINADVDDTLVNLNVMQENTEIINKSTFCALHSIWLYRWFILR